MSSHDSQGMGWVRGSRIVEVILLKIEDTVKLGLGGLVPFVFAFLIIHIALLEFLLQKG